jgi:aspartate kinase
VAIIVQKYGGTSVGDIKKINRIAKRVIAKKNEGHDMVLVVSAMGKFTDELVRMAKDINPNPQGREYDALLATGEKISAAVMAMTMESLGEKAISLTGGQAGVLTEDIHTKAKIRSVETSRITQELNQGKLVVITGFQGINSQEDITTIGRGGSDTSAVAIAGALNASVCEIFTDVDGVYTTNPSIEPNARKLKEITYDEMLELASLGAGVLHPRAVESAKENKVVIHVRSSFNDEEGTLVKEEIKMEKKRTVTGIAYDENTAKIAIKNIPDRPGIAADIFTALAQKAINVDMIIQSTAGENMNNITFTVPKDDLAEAAKTCKQLAADFGSGEIVTDKDVTKVSIVGVGMISSPGVAAKMFDILAKEGINIDLITTSEIKISCAIDQHLTKKAIKALHKGFNLDK